MIVANQFPTVTAAQRIAIVGEAPGKDEEASGKPFVGMSGKFLDSILSSAGIVRSTCFIGNICQVRPPDNDLSKFKWDGPEIADGLAALRADLTTFKPNLVVLLGKTALRAAYNTTNLADWRGSVFLSANLTTNSTSLKCLASYHPAACLRMYELTPLLRFDLLRAAKEGCFPELRLPQRTLVTQPTYEEVISTLDNILVTRPTIACDIEGGIRSLSCISLATSPQHSFIVPFINLDGSSTWTASQEVEVWRRLCAVLNSPDVPKVWQNGLYDRFVLQHSYNIIVRGNADDTMLKWWEQFCELEKALAVQASLLTDEPYYKFERHALDDTTFRAYCCKDSALTYEINSKLSSMVTGGSHQHYTTNNELLNVLLYMELRGIKYNHELAQERLAEVLQEVYTYQYHLDEEAKRLGVVQGLDWDARMLPQVQNICCHKRNPSQPKKGFEDGYLAVVESLDGELSFAMRGRIAMLCKVSMNTKSKKFKDFLYDVCKLPVQWKKDPKTKEMRPTTDYESLLRLSKSHDHPVLRLALELSRLRTRAQMLAIRPYKDRMYCSYNLVGSETGRITSSKSILCTQQGRVGTNLQTIPSDWELDDEEHPLSQGMRDLFVADDGCYLAKCDLKASDGWTVGCYLASLGDPTMLDDLRGGVKPTQVPALILMKGHDYYNKYARDRAELKAVLAAEVPKDSWQYFASKVAMWASCYTAGPRKLSERVFVESDGKVQMSEAEMRDFQQAIFARYRVKLWHAWMQRQINESPYPFKLTAANGFTRRFFGRKTEILGEALAHLPQVYTTHATLLAARRLWNDPDNRVATGSIPFRVEPLHQVHDELLVQFKIADTAWATRKIIEWFDNPVVIAGQIVTIPFEGVVGTAWSMDDTHKVMEIK